LSDAYECPYFKVIWELEKCYKCAKAGECPNYATGVSAYCEEFEPVRDCWFCVYFDKSMQRCILEEGE